MDVLIVEDDAALGDVVAVHLAAEGWRLRRVTDGDAALAACAEQLPDLVVLDVMLPKRSGLEVCAALRALYHPSPGVVMVTARDTELDVILGFEVGADDYVLKPFRPRELVARVRALQRRLGRGVAALPAAGAPRTTGSVIAHGELRIDADARRASVGELALRLTPTEFELLLLLARTPDRAWSRKELLEQVFESTHEGYSRNVDSHVMRLRKKIELAGIRPAPIRTVQGTGYRFEVA
ncbi:MAG TPA: response regulator transcription factor [Kofleriaceae bacterium]|nr:response regulator transcription factor [Kofleriaceae bacterium]